MPVSIVDYENLIRDPLSLGLFRNLVRMNPIIKLFPIVRKKTLVVKGQEWDELPIPEYRDLNEQYTDSTGTTKPVEERQAILGGSFKIDKVFDELGDEQYQEPEEQQFQQWNVAIDRKLTNDVFNGDIDTDPKGFNGLYKRFGLAGGFPSGSIVKCAATDTLKVLANATNAKAFFDCLDDAMYECDLWGSGITGIPKGALFMNKATFKGFQRAAKLTDYSIQQEDLLGYRWHTYMGIPLVDVGLQRDRATEIILDTYDPGDAGDDSSRIFCVRFSEADGDIDSPGSRGLSLLEASPYKVLGPEEYLEYYRWGVQWILGLVHIGDNHSAALLTNYKMAAS